MYCWCCATAVVINNIMKATKQTIDQENPTVAEATESECMMKNKNQKITKVFGAFSTFFFVFATQL